MGALTLGNNTCIGNLHQQKTRPGETAFYHVFCPQFWWWEQDLGMFCQLHVPESSVARQCSHWGSSAMLCFVLVDLYTVRDPQQIGEISASVLYDKLHFITQNYFVVVKWNRTVIGPIWNFNIQYNSIKEKFQNSFDWIKTKKNQESYNEKFMEIKQFFLDTFLLALKPLH